MPTSSDSGFSRGPIRRTQPIPDDSNDSVEMRKPIKRPASGRDNARRRLWATGCGLLICLLIFITIAVLWFLSPRTG